MNFAKKQSDNVEQQETEPSTLPSPLGLLNLLRPRPAPTELRALVADEPEDLDTEDEGLISFEEERVSGQHILPATLPPRGSRGRTYVRELAVDTPAFWSHRTGRDSRMLRTRVDMGKPGWAETKGRAQNTPAALKTPDQRQGFPETRA